MSTGMPVWRSVSSRPPGAEHGFTLVELLVSMAITTIILGTTLSLMNDAVKATDAAVQLTHMNNGLRTSMDLVVRDLLQVGQGLPPGHVIQIPSGDGAQPIRLPGPPGTNYQLAGAIELPAVVPGPGLGPTIDGQPTDMMTTLAADSAFDHVPLTALAADGSSITVAGADLGGTNITDGGPDDIRPGDLLMLSRGGTNNTLVEVTRVAGQTVSFDAGDSLNLNQSGAAAGNAAFLYNLGGAAPDDEPNPPAAPTIDTDASRIRMISYYIDGATDPRHPRLVRRINNGDPLDFDNTLGTAVAFDVENLQITYDLANSSTNPANVRMVAADLEGTGVCAPDECHENQIRKVNVLLAVRSRSAIKNAQSFLRNRLLTQVSLRSMAFRDRYQTE